MSHKSVKIRPYPSLNKRRHREGIAGNGQWSRRSFLSKSALVTAGFLLAPGMAVPETGLYQTRKNNEELYRRLDELVDKYYPLYGTCSQTSFHALNEVFDLGADNIIRGLVSFPGVALRGETCGAVTGSLLAIGLAYEEDIIDEGRKRQSRPPSFKFCSEFEKEFGTTRCRDVIEHITGKRYPVAKHEDYEAMYKKGVFKLCPKVIKKAVKTAADIILEKT
jgi:C_GCAxxG_C_C family probable redox protein